MARLDQASQRLNAALDRLERVVEARVEAAGTAAAQEVEDDRVSLREEIEALRAENRELRAAGADAGRRLDTAIQRLHGVLES